MHKFDSERPALGVRVIYEPAGVRMCVGRAPVRCVRQR